MVALSLGERPIAVSKESGSRNFSGLARKLTLIGYSEKPTIGKHAKRRIVSYFPANFQVSTTSSHSRKCSGAKVREVS